jgi:hypothetical protein
MSSSHVRPDPTPDAHLAIERWSVTSGSERQSRANLALTGGGRTWRAHAVGDGAIDALMRAVDDALSPALGAGVELVTYGVHATGPGHETAGEVTVSIRWRDAQADAPVYPGRAVHDNVLDASVHAYLDAINALLADNEIDLAAFVPERSAADSHAEAAGEARAHAASRIQASYNP